MSLVKDFRRGLLLANRDFLPDDITERVVPESKEKETNPFRTCCMVACDRPNPEEIFLHKEEIKEEEIQQKKK